MQIKASLAKAITQLNSDEATLEAQLLLQHVLNVNRAWLIAHEADALTSEQLEIFEALLQRRINGEPIAYILGYREFFGLNLKVTPDTLIPRPDTETLVEAALSKIPQSDNISDPSFPRKRESMLNLNKKMDGRSSKLDLMSDSLCSFSRFRGNDELRNISENIHVLDLGTGTGAIALAIAKNRPNTQVTAGDFSENALKVAWTNAKKLNIQNVTFLQSNWFLALNNQRFDMIVSNPPYIENDDAHLTQGDLRFEPKSALTSGADGLDDIRHIVRESLSFLNPQGWLMLEHGYNQAEKVRDLMAAHGFAEIATMKDFGGNDRVTIGKSEQSSPRWSFVY